MLYRRLSLAALLSFSVALFAGCDKGAGDTVSAEDCPKVSEREVVAAPELETLPIQVELPTSPDFESAKAPIKWEGDPDGAYSIYGLREDIDERLKEGESGQTVVVKGWVQEIYVPPVCPEDELCPPAKQPHFWITDGPDETGKKRAMMVVNYDFPIPEWDADTQKMWEDEPEVIIDLGKQYTFRGTFKRFSDTGFAHDNGLLEFHSYKAPSPDPEAGGQMIWIYPPNSYWHPRAVAAQEAANAAMQERMRKSGRGGL